MTKQRQASYWIVVSVLVLSVQSANAEAQDLSGRWETTLGIMTLKHLGDSVAGAYVVEGYPCSIEGKVRNRRFDFKSQRCQFDSSELNASREGWLEFDSRGDRFTGSWREVGESTWRVWSGTRNPAPSSPVFGLDLRFAAGKGALAIPFDAENNHIRLRVGVNGSLPVFFILDTGASSNYPILGLRSAESLGMKPLPLNAKGSGVGVDFANLHIVKDPTSLSLPGLMFSSQWLLVVSLDTANGCMDQAISGGKDRPAASSQGAKEAALRFFDGVIGRGFFSSLVVEIDYSARLINLYDPRSYEYTGNGMSLPLEMDSNYIYVRTQVKAAGRPPVTVRLIVDTGSGGTLTLNKQFAAAHGLLPPAEQLTAANECGMGGLAEGPSYEGRLEGLQLGNLTLSNPATFFRHTPVGEGYDGLLGNVVLRNFKVIFDFSRGRMILEPLRQVGGNR